MNELQAYPQIDIQCADRVRRFCLNLRAFNALTAYMKQKLGVEKYDLFSEYDWDSTDIETINVTMWAGFLTDAEDHDADVFTIEKCQRILDLSCIAFAKNCIQQSLARAMSVKQVAHNVAEKAARDAKKKRANGLRKKAQR